ncbi:MAG: hypothetical protein ACUVV0_12240 [Anaerolineae bacterium]
MEEIAEKVQLIPLISIPPAFSWLAHLEEEEQTEFYQELFMAVASAWENGKWEDVAETIEDWRETALERADIELQKTLAEARQELVAGKGHPTY